MFGGKNYLGLLVPKNTLDDETAGNIQNLVKKAQFCPGKMKKRKKHQVWLVESDSSEHVMSVNPKV